MKKHLFTIKNMGDLFIHSDFSKTVVLTPGSYQWSPSPAKGVERMMLDRLGAESGHATSFVRFEPNSTFHEHAHEGGEEFFVLEGTFSDEHADYPAGTYVRNPTGTAHTPHIGAQGCRIFVKLCQFNLNDREQFSINTHDLPWTSGEESAFEIKALHEFDGVVTRLEKRAAGAAFTTKDKQGTELLILSGKLECNNESCPAGTWIRSAEELDISVKEESVLFVKTGHIKP